MSSINKPEIIAEEVSMFVVAAIVGGRPRRVLKNVGMNFAPLIRTWYEEEVDTDTTQTIRFAKRSDHTGVLIQINKAEFYDSIDELA